MLIFGGLYGVIIQKLDINQIIYRLSEARHSLRSNSATLANHLISSLAFLETVSHW